MKNSIWPGNKFIEIFESFFILFSSSSSLNTNGSKFRYEKKWNGRRRKEGLLIEYKVRELVSWQNWRTFFFLSNTLVDNTPPLSPTPPPLKKGGKIINKCRGKDDPGYISVWIFDFVLFFSSSSLVWFWTQAAQSFVRKRKWFENKRGHLDRGKTIVAYQVHKIDEFFFWNVQQARKWHHFQGNNNESRMFITCYFFDHYFGCLYRRLFLRLGYWGKD